MSVVSGPRSPTRSGASTPRVAPRGAALYLALMTTTPPGRHEREEARRREALEALDAVRRHDEGVVSSAFVRAARRATDHFAAKDAASDAAGDPIELWGRRIGRTLSLAGVIVLSIYLFFVLFR